MLDVREHAPLGPATTLEIGGPARWYAEARDDAGLREALAFARAREVEVTLLGGGSNLVVHDRGVEGLVVRVGLRGVSWADDGDAVLATVAAGETWDDFVGAAVARRLVGVECLSGIPGLVGATPIQNVGAYGQEVADTIARVDVLDRETGAHSELEPAACEFAYRDSRFKGAWRDRFVVTCVVFRLRRGVAPALRYGELTRHFGDRAPSVGEVRDAVIALRRAKSMVLDDADENRRSAGSFFMNPIVDEATASRVEAAHVARGGAGVMPRFVAEGGVKLAAGWLIEQAGFRKGQTFGRVGISTRHALALVNRGGASSQELVAAAGEIRRGVFAELGVTLVPEPELVGFTSEEISALRGPLG